MTSTTNRKRPHEFIESGQRIFVSGGTNEPASLLDALREAKLPRALNFIQFPIGGLNQTDFTAFNDTARVTTFFMTPALAKADLDRVEYLPMQMRATYDYLLDDLDVALIQIGRDRHGDLRLGPNVDFLDAVLSSADTVIAELNHQLVVPAGCPKISPERLDCIFESDRPVPEMQPPQLDDAALEIGRLVGDLIQDGDCIQTGIGAIPAAILAQLKDKSDLGMHGGLIDDAGMALIRNGNVTGARKGIDTGFHITGAAMGTHELIEWLGETPRVLFRSANHTHEVAAIRQLDNFVSVNSAVEIDLDGQINAEYAGGRQISGTGGSVDFMRAAKASNGGRSIVAMNATARGGTVSRIVRRVEMVTALRTDVDLVVTEYGVADLKNLPVRARHAALIDIAAPQFRDELRNPA